jgi:HlyD family secretion protein
VSAAARPEPDPSQGRGLMRRWRGWLGAALVLLLALTAVWAWRNRPLSVQVLQVQPTELVRSLQFSARVSTLSRVDLGSTVTGRVVQVLVTDGTRVRVGQTLLELESAQESAALQQALASQQQAAARLAGLRASGRSSARAAQAQSQAALTAAEAELTRAGRLVEQGFVSASRVDEARRARDVALAQLAGADAAASALSDAGTEIAQAQAQLRLATAASELARARLAQARVSAPSDGQILSRAVEPGQIVQPGRPLLTLALDGPSRIVAQVDERFLEQLAPGQAAWAVADAYPGQRIALSVLSIAPLVDAQRGAVEVKLELRGPAPAFLRQDMTLSVEVETARRAAAIAVPLSALVAGAAAETLELRVVTDGRVRSRAVRIGLRTLDAAEVVEGLRAGDQVVLDPATPVGRRVRADAVVVRFGSAAGSGAAESGASALTNAMGR